MTTAQDYLASKLEETESHLKTAEESLGYWKSKAVRLMKELGYSDEKIDKEFEKASNSMII